MSIEALRTFEDPFYTMTVALDGADYLLEFRYNQREACWYFDISLSDGTILVRGVKVVCGFPLLRRFADNRLPAGTLMAISNTDDRGPPTLLELGDETKRVTLVYFSMSEGTTR